MNKNNQIRGLILIVIIYKYEIIASIGLFNNFRFQTAVTSKIITISIFELAASLNARAIIE